MQQVTANTGRDLWFRQWVRSREQQPPCVKCLHTKVLSKVVENDSWPAKSPNPVKLKEQKKIPH